MIRIDDEGRIRIITLDRPEARNAFNEALYDAATDALDRRGSRQLDRRRCHHRRRRQRSRLAPT